MQNRCGRLAAIARAAALVSVALAITTPAAAQFGGLKKKLKSTAGAETVKPAAPDEARAATTGDAGGTVVLTADVLDQLVTGLKAGEAERQAAAKADTPYGKYQRAVAAYEIAQPKCQEGQQTFHTRAASDEKLMDRYSAMVDKMVAAQTRGDQKMTVVYSDSAMAMQDPNCVVKQPEQPDDYYEAQRAIDGRAEKTAIKSSGMSSSEFAQARERAEGLLRGGTPPGDASPSEKSAVAARAAELKPLLGIKDAPPARATKPAPAPTAAAQPQAPAAPAGMAAMNACMSRNTQAHQKELEALAKRAESAQKAGNQAGLMAIADTLQQIQMAGCVAGR
jgi:hypothetical protein